MRCNLFDSMKILLCNDDGYQAPGIVALYEALSAVAEVEVEVVAPEQSPLQMLLAGVHTAYTAALPPPIPAGMPPPQPRKCKTPQSVGNQQIGAHAICTTPTDRQGFEPWIGFHRNTLSSRAP